MKQASYSCCNFLCVVLTAAYLKYRRCRLSFVWHFFSLWHTHTHTHPYLPTFGKLKSGHLRCDVIETMIAKQSLRGRSPCFSVEGPGAWSPGKILKTETVKCAFFNVLVNDSTHLLQEKIGLKYIQLAGQPGVAQAFALRDRSFSFLTSWSLNPKVNTLPYGENLLFVELA